MNRLRTTIFSLTTAAVLGGASGLLAVSAPTAAQDAMGSGNVMDANLSTRGRYNAPSPSSRIDYRLRNLIVTGDVAAGRGFRDSVGYLAPGDFRGDLGSDDLFGFRADSALSNPVYIRNQQRLQDLQAGRDFNVVEYERSGRGASGAQLPSARRADLNLGLYDPQLRIDRLVGDTNTTGQLERLNQPGAVGAAQLEDGRRLTVTASSTRGLTAELLEEEYAMDGLNMLDRIRLRDDLQSGRFGTDDLGRPFESDLFPSHQRDEVLTPEEVRAEADRRGAVTPTRVEAEPGSTAISSRVNPSPDYTALIEKIRERYQDREGTDLEIDFRGIRKSLETDGGRFAEEQSQAEAATQAQEGAPDGAPEGEAGRPRGLPEVDQTGRVRPEAGADRQPGEGGLSSGANDPFRRAPAPSVARTPELSTAVDALRHDQRITSLAAEGDDRFNELMREGDAKLRAGEYLSAERFFNRALRFQPDQPLGVAGSAHAQIGAGLHASAAFTLRGLFTRNPEMIDATYDEELLPNRARINQVLRELDAKLQRDPDPSDAALVLAYLGRHLNEQELMDRGLRILEQTSRDEQLALLLRRIWLERPEPSAGDAGETAERDSDSVDDAEPEK